MERRRRRGLQLTLIVIICWLFSSLIRLFVWSLQRQEEVKFACHDFVGSGDHLQIAFAPSVDQTWKKILTKSILWRVQRDAWVKYRLDKEYYMQEPQKWIHGTLNIYISIIHQYIFCTRWYFSRAMSLSQDGISTWSFQSARVCDNKKDLNHDFITEIAHFHGGGR